MKNITIIVICFLVLFSCKRKNIYQEAIKEEISTINSLDDRKTYLNKIYDDSEGISIKIKELEKNFLLNKHKVKLLHSKKDSLIFINRLRVNEYLKKFEYPSDTTTYSKNEKNAIYFAVYYDYKVNEQLKYLSIFDDLYRKGLLDTYSYLSFLNRIYYLSKSSFFKYDKKHGLEKMIDDIYPEILKLKKK